MWLILIAGLRATFVETDPTRLNIAAPSLW